MESLIQPESTNPTIPPNNADSPTPNQSAFTLGNSDSTSRNKCTFYRCVKQLLPQTDSDTVQQRKLSKLEREHLLRYHSLMPVRLKSLAQGLTVEYSRCPDADMKFQCCCGKTFIPRSSVSRHFDQCEAARSLSIYPNLKYRGLSILDSTTAQPDSCLDSVDDSDEGGEDIIQGQIGDQDNRPRSSMDSPIPESTLNIYKAIDQLKIENKDMIQSLSFMLGSQINSAIGRSSVTEEMQNNRISQVERWIKQIDQRLCRIEQSIWNSENLRAPSTHTVTKHRTFNANTSSLPLRTNRRTISPLPVHSSSLNSA